MASYQLDVIDYKKALQKSGNIFNSFKTIVSKEILDGINSFISIIMCFHYIISTQYAYIIYNEYAQNMLLVVRLYFLIEYMINILVSKVWKKYCMSGESMVEFISIVPYFIIQLVHIGIDIKPNAYTWIDIGNMTILFRIYLIERNLKYTDSEINKKLGMICVSMFALILISASLLMILIRSETPSSQFYKKEQSEYDMLRYIYFIFTTISTVGYGNDFQSPYSRILLVIIIFVALSSIPQNSAQLIQLLSSKSMYARRRYKRVDNTIHIVLTGTVSTIAALDFFIEFFHDDHGDQPRQIVILQPFRPSEQMQNLINMPLYTNRVFYIQGEPLQESDLRRCQCEQAKAVIILCDKQSADAQEEDSKCILIAMVLKKFLKPFKTQTKLCMQLLRREGKTHYHLSVNKQTSDDQVICIEELKLNLLAKSCLCPGLVAFVTNLISSSGDPPDNLNINWLQEYWSGQGYEVYRINMNNCYVGKSFSSISAHIYRNFSSILFALELCVGEVSDIYINPGDYIIPPSDFNKFYGYIISSDKSVADEISNLVIDTDENQREFIKTQSFRYINKISSSKKSNQNNNRQITEDSDSDNEKLTSQNDEDLQMSKKDNQNDVEQQQGHVSPQINNLADITFKTMENNILATNHILLCGLVPELLNFIQPLRAKYLDKISPIVILHTSDLTEKQWTQISLFPEIYFVKGCALNKQDLIRANIKYASKVVILTPNVEEIKKKRFIYRDSYDELKSNHLTRDQEDLLDAKTIFKYKVISKVKPGIPIVTELVCPSNLTFLLPKPSDQKILKDYGYSQTPTFASGQIYISSVIDSLICQSYYNPALIKVLTKLLLGSQNDQKLKDYYPNITTSNLYHLLVPQAFVNQNFQKIFIYLTKRQNIVPLGIYRRKLNDNLQPYIVTNPDPELKLDEEDMIFVLAQKSPDASSKQWGAPLDIKTQNSQTQDHDNKQSKIDHIYLSISKKNDQQWLENDKDYIKAKTIMINESQKIINKIDYVMNEIIDVQQKTSQLHETIIDREQTILQKIKTAIGNELKQVISNENQQNQQNDNQSQSDESSSNSESSSNQTEYGSDQN